jgi:hypothetical protein
MFSVFSTIYGRDYLYTSIVIIIGEIVLLYTAPYLNLPKIDEVIKDHINVDKG